MRVRYEDLVLRPEVTPTEALGVHGHRLRRRCSRPSKQRRTAAHAHAVSAHWQARQPSRIDGWRTALTPRQIERFERRVDEFLRYFGYPLLYGIKARPPSRRERVAAVFEEVRRQARRRRRTTGSG